VGLRRGEAFEEGRARIAAVRDVIGSGRRLVVDVAPGWPAAVAAERAAALASYEPAYLDDPVEGTDLVALRAVRAAVGDGIGISMGAGVHRAVVFKQLLVERLVDAVRPDPTVLGGVNEALTVLLLAARLNTPACPTVSARGPLELAADLAFIDYVAIGASLDDRLASVPAELAANDARTGGARVERGRLVVL
jgi:L-fuconate dehydratase